MYATLIDRPRKRIHVLRVDGDSLDAAEIDDLAERMRQRALSRSGEQVADVVVIQGDGKETLRLYGEPHAVTLTRAALFNAALSWVAIELD